VWQVCSSPDCHLLPLRAGVPRAEGTGGPSRRDDVRGSNPRGWFAYRFDMPGLQVRLSTGLHHTSGISPIQQAIKFLESDGKCNPTMNFSALLSISITVATVRDSSNNDRIYVSIGSRDMIKNFLYSTSSRLVSI
jgi:hypothetical protein